MRSIASTLILNGTLALAQTQTIYPPAAPGPLSNPLKGFAPFAERGTTLFQHNHTMAYQYASWADLEPEEGKYAFDKWEKNSWETPESKGRHIVFRVYLDYPSMAVGVPKWLLAKGVKLTKYTDYGGGSSPDYENPQLRSSLKKFISALGRRYNTHPRVAFIQLGILGFWGEWHTYPRNELFASESVQQEVVQAMHQAFPNKHLLARQAVGPMAKTPWIGYHDDMIPQDTLGPDAWDFLPVMRTAGRTDNWKVAPTGGEMVPGAAAQYMGKDYATLQDAINKAHFTFIGPYGPTMFDGKDKDYKTRSDEVVRQMGYQFQLKEITATKSLVSGSELTLKLKGINQGVAPFYYPWQVKLSLIDSSGRIAQSWGLPDDIRKWLPGDFELSTHAKVNLKPGSYSLCIGIIDPWKQTPAIQFANDLPYNAGWTKLSTVQVK